MVLLVPDDMPAGATTLAGNVEEMRALYKDWDPRHISPSPPQVKQEQQLIPTRIPKLLSMCEEVSKWKLQIRLGMEKWSHPSASFTMLGDAVHATLPYLASGAGMSLEDAAVLGEVLSRIPSKSRTSKQYALKVYEACRAPRTRMVVERGNIQQYL
jgi:salicylate hydroxylase